MKKLLKGFLDIETSYALGAYWGGRTWEQDILFTDKQSIILCYTIKWENGQTVTHALPDYPQFKKDRWDDSGICKDLWEDFDKAHILVAHNGDNFDIPKVLTRLLYHGYVPPLPFETIDTKKVAKRFAFPSNKLDDLCEYLGIGKKLRHEGLEMWKKCMEGDLTAWKKMVRYNRHDVVLEQKLYDRFRPYIKNHPNEAAITERPGNCKNCGSDKFHSKGTRMLSSGNFKLMFRCIDCGKPDYGPIKRR